MKNSKIQRLLKNKKTDKIDLENLLKKEILEDFLKIVIICFKKSNLKFILKKIIKFFKNIPLNQRKKKNNQKMNFKLKLKNQHQISIQINNLQISNFNQYLFNKLNKDRFLKMIKTLKKDNYLIHLV